MNFIVWNCRGTAAIGFAGLVKDLRRNYSSSMIALLETHTSGAHANKIIKRIGFQNKFIQEAQGQSGGSWLLWDPKVWNIKVISSTRQMIHIEVLTQAMPNWLITFI